MRYVFTFTLFFAWGLESAHAAKKCADGLQGTRPDRKTLGPGAELRLKPQLKEITLLPNTYTGLAPAETVTLYVGESALNGGYKLPPGIPLRALSGVKASERIVEVEVIGREEIRGWMFWVDIYNNALVEKMGEPPVRKTRKASAKFPDKASLAKFETLAAAGKTIYGRPFARVGDLVWIANHSRIMSRNSVGRVIEISRPLDPANWRDRGLARIETLAGHVVEAYHYDCNPMSEAEAEGL